MAAPDDVPGRPADAPRSSPGSGAIVLVIESAITPADVPALSERIRVLLQDSEANLVICDVGALTAPDAGTVDALARLALAARRLGRRVRLRHAPRELRGLLALTGLSEVLPPYVGPPHETEGLGH